MATKKSPEYKTLREHFHDICDALSRLPNTITPLANDLSSASIISGATRSAVTSTVGVAPYDRASQLLSAAHVTIEYNQHKFYEFADKLVKHDLAPLAQILYQKCGEYVHVRTNVTIFFHVLGGAGGGRRIVKNFCTYRVLISE